MFHSCYYVPGYDDRVLGGVVSTYRTTHSANETPKSLTAESEVNNDNEERI